jgi:putative transcriptional regulator
MSRMIEEAVETMRGLHEAGVVDEPTLRSFEALAMPPPEYSAAAIHALRERLHLSQAAFAAYLNASPASVKQWESGKRRPRGAALRLLSVIDRRGIEVLG